MDKLIPVVNKLQDAFNAIGTDAPLDLPQIVVVGSQSSGKSSVLESIVGRDFLPRGSGIVTRRPLLLQLIYVPPDNQGKGEVEWGEFLHKPGEMFYDFEKIREEIESETEKVTGKNKGISEVPINLKIYSPNVLNLTLVDLPGITRVPVGDQPPDIEMLIRKMIKKYIEKPNSIILAITPANTDLANSDALQLAKEVDPEGDRTLGVLTKLDIMDKGTDALDMLMGRVIPLKLGFIGVVNRSQHDIVSKKPIREALKDEADFFNTHHLYHNIASRSGVPFLSKSLNKILIQHIRNTLPELKIKINKMLAEYQQELEAYGDSLYDSKGSRGALLLQIITRFCNSFRDAINGQSTELSINELYGGARINYIFTEVFSKCLLKIHPTQGLTQNDIRTAIRNATGPKAALFVPEAAFELLVKGQISRLEEPSLQCVELVHEELQRIVAQLETKELVRFTRLREKVVEVVHDLLNQYRVPTKKMISNLIEIELAFINTNHPDFVGGDGAIAALVEKQKKNAQPETQASSSMKSSSHPSSAPSQTSEQSGFFSVFFGGNQGNPSSRGGPIMGSKRGATSNGGSRLEQVPVTLKPTMEPSDKEKFETELIKHLLVSYFDIVKKNIQDTIPKTIMHFLVNCSKENMQNELVSQLYKEELFDELLEESQVIAQRRKTCISQMKMLREAHEILNQVRDFSVN